MRAGDKSDSQAWRLVLRARLQFGMITAVEQDTGKRGIVQFDRPAAWVRRTENVGYNGLGSLVTKRQPGFGS